MGCDGDFRVLTTPILSSSFPSGVSASGDGFINLLSFVFCKRITSLEVTGAFPFISARTKSRSTLKRFLCGTEWSLSSIVRWCSWPPFLFEFLGYGFVPHYFYCVPILGVDFGVDAAAFDLCC